VVEETASATRPRGGQVVSFSLQHRPCHSPTHFETLSSRLNCPIMSHTQPTPSSSSDFALIFDDALKAYQKRTKHNLLEHPLAVQLQACNSTTSILTLLHQQVHEFNQNRSSDERLSKWLDPTVNVLYALSGKLGEGVGLVCFVTARLAFSSLCSFFFRFIHPPK
jgi:hypothetical protein